MAKNTSLMLFFLMSVIMISCTKKKENSIIGLWVVEKVEIDEEEMTPNARWMNFKEDSTQVSGNGWLQHSIGSWKLNNKELIIKNTNGIEDEANPFEIEIKGNSMLWNRIEEEQKVKVYLTRTKEIPTSKGNELLGLWKLESMSLGVKDSLQIEVDKKSTLFLRWDNTYVKEGTLTSKEYGVYKIHGHKPELQLVNYGDTPKFSFYKFSISKNKLLLKSTDGREELRYVRTHQFIQ